MCDFDTDINDSMDTETFGIDDAFRHHSTEEILPSLGNGDTFSNDTMFSSFLDRENLENGDASDLSVVQESVSAEETHVTNLIGAEEGHETESHGEVSFLGHSQSEINSHKSQAEHDIAEAKSDMRHHKSMADSKARMGEPHAFEDYQYQQAKHRLEEAQSELNKWSRMRPDK